MVAVELHHLAQVAHHLPAPAVVGHLQQLHVKLLVQGKEQVALVHGRCQPVVQRMQDAQLAGRGGARHHTGRVALQQAEQVVDIAQVFFRHLGDIGAAPHLHGHQPFGGQHLQRFAQGRAADAEIFGNFQLVDPAAGFELAAEDALAQLLGNFLVQSTGGQNGSGHAGECTKAAAPKL